MYRILLASSDYYYVQKRYGCSLGWVKVGGFFSTRSGARQFINDHRNQPNRVVEYY